MKKILTSFFKIAVTAGLLWWLSRYVDYKLLSSFIKNIPLSAMILIFFLGVLNLAGQAIRYFYVVNQIMPPYTFKQGLLSYFSGFTFRFLLPASIGEIGKTFYLPGTMKQRLFTFIIDAFFCTGTMFFFFGISAFLLYPNLWYMLSFSLIYFIFYGIYFLLKDKSFLKKHIPDNVPYGKIAFVNIGITIITYITFIFQYWVLLRDFGLSFFTQSKICFFVLGVGAVPVSFAGLGLREGALCYALKPFEVPGEAAVGVSLLVFFINIIIPAFVGVILVTFFSHLKLSDIKSHLDVKDLKKDEEIISEDVSK